MNPTTWIPAALVLLAGALDAQSLFKGTLAGGLEGAFILDL